MGSGASKKSTRVQHPEETTPTSGAVPAAVQSQSSPSAAVQPSVDQMQSAGVDPGPQIASQTGPPSAMNQWEDAAAQLSRLPKAAVMSWRYKAWDGEQLRDIFVAMDTDSSKRVDRQELAAFLAKMDFGQWKQAEVDELYAFLDVDGDGLISIEDFTSSVVSPLLREQLERGIRSELLGKVVCKLLPVPNTWTQEGRLVNPFEKVAKLKMAELKELLSNGVDEIAAHIWMALGPVREELERAEAEQASPKNVSFKFAFVNVAAVEKGSLNEYLGLPAEDIDKAMEDEHDSTEEWMTGNYNLTTNPKQEWEFVECPNADMVYPGEGGGHGRRRQDADELWRQLSAEVPVSELLKDFACSFPTIEAAQLAQALQRLLGSHQTEADKQKLPEQVTELLYELLCSNIEEGAAEGWSNEDLEELGIDPRMSRALKGIGKQLHARWWQDAVRPETGFALDTVNVSDGSGDEDAYHNEFAALHRHMCARLKKALERDASRLVELVAASDLTKAEVKAIMLYTGPLFEKYNYVLRYLPENPPYKNTILMLISGIMKMRKRTELVGERKAFRGLKGGELPASWLLEDAVGSKGGAEKAFMSTSLDRNEAAKYAVRGGNPTLLEIDLGQVDKGADVARLSQYPGEREILFAPMTNLEVLGMPRLELLHGKAIMVLSVRANVSLKNQTREELDGKRKAVFIPALHNTIQETEREVKAVMASQAPRSEVLLEKWDAGQQQKLQRYFLPMVMRPCRDALAAYSDKSAQWFKNDRNYRNAVAEAASLKQLGIARFKALWESRIPWKKRSLNRWHRTPLNVLNHSRTAELRDAWEAARADDSDEGRQRRREAARELTQWEGHADIEHLDALQDDGNRTRLMMAAAEGDVRMVRLLIDAGADATLRNKDLQPPLLIAFRNYPNNLELLRAFGGAGLEAVDRQHMNALQHAVQRSNLPAARALLEMRANPNVPSRRLPKERFKLAQEEPRSLLQFAFEKEKSELMALLREFGAKDLFTAVKLESAEMVKECAEAGDDFDELRRVEGSSDSEKKMAALHYAALHNKVEVAKALAAHGATLALRDSYAEHRTPLRVAIEAKSAEMQAWLLEAGAADLDSAVLLESPEMVRQAVQGGESPNNLEATRAPPLHLAARKGKLAVAEALLAAGADANLTPLGPEAERRDKAWNRKTALGEALEAKQEALVELLTAAGAKDLHSAILLDDAGMVRACAEGGEDVNVTHFLAPLLLAAREGKAEALKALIECGASVMPDQQQQYSAAHRTALQYAVSAENFEIARLLRDAGAADMDSALLMDDADMVRTCVAAGYDVTKYDDKYGGLTALHRAAQKKAANAARALLECKADPHAGQYAGHAFQTPAPANKRTALDEAVLYKAKEVALVLFEAGGVDVKTAIAFDDAEMVRACAAAGLDLEQEIGAGTGAPGMAAPSRPLHQAVAMGCSQAAAALVACSASVSTVERGRTPLQLAALKKHGDIVEMLVAAGAADPYAAVILDDPAMLRACAAGAGGLDEEQAVADINKAKQLHEPPCGSLLHAAVTHRSPKVVPALLEAGARADAVDNGQSALHAAAVQLKTPPLTLFPFGKPVDPAEKAQEEAGRAAVLAALEEAGLIDLRAAVLLDKAEMVRACAAAGHDLGAEREGQRALDYAAEKNSAEAAKALLESGADGGARVGGSTALRRAIEAQAGEVVAVLREAGLGDPHSAGLLGDAEMVQACVAAGARLSDADSDGRTALHLAAAGNQRGVVEALIQGGADAGAVCNEGVTPLLEAAEAQHAEVVALLVAAGAGDVAAGAVLDDAAMIARSVAAGASVDLVVPKSKAPGAGGIWGLGMGGAGGARPKKAATAVTRMAPLHRAAKHNSVAAAQALLEAGADAKLSVGWELGTPAEVAAKERHAELMQMLKAAAGEVDSSDEEEAGGGAGGYDSAGSSSGSSISIKTDKDWEAPEAGADSDGS